MKNELQVSGMRCGGCELLVKEALEEVEGVRVVDASSLRGTVFVDYEPETVGIALIVTVIEEQGFKVKS
jgi:copper chaperone